MEEEIDVELAERLLLQHELEEERRRIQQVIRNHKPLKFEQFVLTKKNKLLFFEKLEMFKNSLESFFPNKWDLIESANDVQIIIHFPEFYIEEIDNHSNLTGKKELLKDAYINFAFLKMENNFVFSPAVYIIRTTFNINHFNIRHNRIFVHSHGKTSNTELVSNILTYRKKSLGKTGYKQQFTNFCTGSAHLNNILNRLADNINETSFESVLYAIDVMIRQESNAGGPYHRFRDYSSQSNIRETIFYENTLISKLNREGTEKTIKLLNKYGLLNFHNYTKLHTTRLNFLQELSDTFLKKYIYISDFNGNECEWRDELLITENDDSMIFEKVQYNEISSHVNNEPLEVLKFKGEPVYLQIYKNSVKAKGIYKSKPKKIIPKSVIHYSNTLEKKLEKYDKIKFNAKYKIS